MIKELPKVMKDDENCNACQYSHIAKTVDQLVRWTWKWEERLKILGKLGDVVEKEEPDGYKEEK
jgi:hypothetical protein